MAKDLGDFQTPPLLVDQVLHCPELTGKIWSRLLEPTCGKGNFIRAFCNSAHPPVEIQAIEIQARYVRQVRALHGPITVHQENIFNMHLGTGLQWASNGSLLVIGNPPWVTSAELSISDSHNHPEKTNLKRLQGLDAMTGNSNFDIAEHILLKLIWELMDAEATIALLCKTSVARNILQFAPQANLPITFSVIRQLDAKRWFNAAVDACLFYVELKPGYYNPKTIVYADLQTTEPLQIMEHQHGQLIANTMTHDKVAFLEGQCTLTWRQGLKHDAASVMELTQQLNGQWQNKEGQLVTIEPEYLYPLLKSSDLAHEPMDKPRKAVIVTQQRLSDNTNLLKSKAPLLWQYLSDHEGLFTKRKSSIYANKPPFSIFGIGDYSFAPYKVAIAGMYKTSRFQAIGPIQLRPVMCDDTCYFIACGSAEQAAFLVTLLNSQICLDFINSIMFKDSKRPVTKKLLQRIDLQTLLHYITPEKALYNASSVFAHLKQGRTAQWPPSLEMFFHETMTIPRPKEFPAQAQLALWNISTDNAV